MSGGFPEIVRWARYTAETFTTPGQFATREEYLAALTEALDELCSVQGLEPPEFEGVFS